MKSNNMTSCSICSGKLSQYNNNYFRCQDCGTSFSTREQESYEGDYYFAKGGRDWKQLKRARLLYRTIKKFIPEGASILDFGCSVGSFVSVCSRYGHECSGTDINQRDIALAKNLGGGEFVLTKDLQKKYSLVTSFDVIEHFKDVSEFWEEIDRLVKEEGTIIISTPNMDSEWIRLFGNSWHGFQIPQYHNCIFSKEGLRKSIQKLGLSLEIKQEFTVGILDYSILHYVLGSALCGVKGVIRRGFKLVYGILCLLYLFLTRKYYTETIFLVIKKSKNS